MFYDLHDNGHGNPKQPKYSELVSEWLKQHVLFKSELDCNENRWMDNTIAYFCRYAKRIWNQHKGKVRGLQVKNIHVTFFNKRVDATNISKCNCENCSGLLEKDNTARQSIDPEEVISTNNITQDDLIDIPTNVLIQMSKLFHVSNDSRRCQIISNLIETARHNVSLRLMICTCKEQQKKFIENWKEDLDSILHDKDETTEHLKKYGLAILEGEFSNQTKRRLMDKIVEVDFIKKWLEATVEVDFMKKRWEVKKTNPLIVQIGKYILLQHFKKYVYVVTVGMQR